MNVLARIVVTAPVFLLAIILHELSHAAVAYLFGDDTAKRAGRITMNPVPHLDPLGALMFILSSIAGVGFGWAKPVPVNIGRLRPRRMGEVAVSVAGVASNLLQAIIWSLLLRALLPHVEASGFVAAAAKFCLLGVQVNVILFCFNLLPIPPLDGFHVITGALGISGTYGVMRLEQMGFLLLFMLIFLGQFSGVDVLSRLLDVGYDPIIHALLSGIS